MALNRYFSSFLVLVLLLTSGLVAYCSSPKQAYPARAKPVVAPALDSLVFIENQGQFDSRVRFQARVAGQTVWLTDSGITFDMQSGVGRRRAAGSLPNSIPTPERFVFKAELVNAATGATIEGVQPQPGKYNFFPGDLKRSRSNVTGYGMLIYHEVWPGIDLKLYSKDGLNLEQEFVVHPGADLNRVRVRYKGIRHLEIAADGALRIHTPSGFITERTPTLYALSNGMRQPLSGGFRLIDSTEYTFRIARIPRNSTAVIDPTVLFSTYLTGRNRDIPSGIAADSTGNVYISGTTSSNNFPSTIGHEPQGEAIFVSKLSPGGNQLLYSTFLGDTSGGAIGTGMALDSAGSVYVAGWSNQNFPSTPNALQACTTAPTGLRVMAKLNSTGDQLLYSTCLGGGYGSNGTNLFIAADNHGRAYLTGMADCDALLTSSAYQSTCPETRWNGFFSVVDTNKSGSASLVYSTYFGMNDTRPTGVAVDDLGNGYITGTTTDAALPVTAGAYQDKYYGQPCVGAPVQGGGHPCTAGFVAKFNPSASGIASVLSSTYLGGTYSVNPTGIAIDISGNVYVAGQFSVPFGVPETKPFPTTEAAYQSTQGNGFLTKLNPGLNYLIFSTFFPESIASLSVDFSGKVAVTGATRNPTFPVTSDAYQPTIEAGGAYGYAAFLTEFTTDGSQLAYSSFLGGRLGDNYGLAITLDSIGDAYVTGTTSSPLFPTTTGAFQLTRPTKDACDFTGSGTPCPSIFITKFPLGTTSALSVQSVSPNHGGTAGTVTPQITGSGFHNGATAKLVCNGLDITGTNTTVSARGQLLNATFDLTKSEPGTCDVVVTNADGTSVTLGSAFTVQQGGTANIQTDLLGLVVVPPAERVGPARAAYYVTATNIGAVDAPNTLVTSALEPSFSVASVEPRPLADLDASTAGGVVGWWVPNLTAGQSMSFAYVGTFPAASSTAPAPASSAPPASAAFPATSGPVIALPGGPFPPFPIQIPPPPATGPTTLSTFIDCVGNEYKKDPEELLSQCALAAAAYAAAQDACSPGPGYSRTKCFWAIVSLLVQANRCPLLSKCLPPLRFFSVLLAFESDPNALVGPPGVGLRRWIMGEQTMTYIVGFNNEPAATAPAQRIVVNQPLSLSLNLSTIRLLGMTIPNGSGTSAVQVSIPPGSFNPAVGLNDFKTTIDLRPTQNLLVNVDAALNLSTRSLTWTFTSIDPVTGMPPLNLLDGFLPKGTGGSVAFAVIPSQDLSTTSPISEKASVVFDSNAAVSTPTWTNTIDNTSPISKVAPLPSRESHTSFPVSWSGTDVGSGIQSFTIYVSDNGRGFTPWLTSTPAMRGSYSGLAGHTYRFYSVARDFVGNVEGAKTTAEATTTVQGSSSCATDVSSQLTISRGGFRFDHATNSFVQILTITNNGATLSATALVLDGLHSGTRLSNSDGSTECASIIGSPWIGIPGTLSTGQSVSVNLIFSDPTKTSISYSTRVLAGNGQK